MSVTITWAEYDRLRPELQAQLVNIRLPDGSTAWKHRSGQEVTVVPPPKVSAEEWKKMGPAARYEYARSHSR